MDKRSLENVHEEAPSRPGWHRSFSITGSMGNSRGAASIVRRRQGGQPVEDQVRRNGPERAAACPFSCVGLLWPQRILSLREIAIESCRQGSRLG